MREKKLFNVKVKSSLLNTRFLSLVKTYRTEVNKKYDCYLHTITYSLDGFISFE